MPYSLGYPFFVFTISYRRYRCGRPLSNNISDAK